MKENKKMNDLEIPVGKVSLIVGENGSGKSTALNAIAKDFHKRGFKVVAIANTPFDKFHYKPSRSGRFHFMGASQGKRLPQNIIKEALKKVSVRETYLYRRISMILEYVGYSGVLGVRVGGVREINDYEEDIISENYPEYDRQLRFALSQLIDESGKSWVGKSDVISLISDEGSLEQLSRYRLVDIIKYEKVLKRLGIIDDIEFFLRKNYESVPLKEASSGELVFLSVLIYLATVAGDGIVVLIDEPENSLHPKWQREYISQLGDVLSYFNATIVAATHAPLIVLGAESSGHEIKIFRAAPDGIIPIEDVSVNVEQLLWEVFGVATPENRYMSNHFVDLLNSLATKEKGLDVVQREISRFRESVKDDMQRSLLDGVHDIALKIDLER